MTLAPELVQLRALLVSCLSANNTERSTAEATLNGTYALQQPDALLQGLAQLLGQDEEPSIRSLAAVLFRRSALRPSNPEAQKVLWHRVSDATRQGSKHLLLEALRAEQVDAVRRKIVDTSAEVYKHCTAHAQPWPQLQPTLSEMASSSQAPHRDCAFRLITSAPALLARQTPDASRSLFASHLADPSIQVRVSVLRALVAFIKDAEKRVQSAFSAIIGNIPQVSLGDVASSGEEVSLQEALTSITELAEASPRLLRPALPGLTAFCVQCMDAEALEDQTRSMAAEVLLTLTENAPGMMRKEPSFVVSFLPACLRWVCLVEEDEDWYTTATLDNEDNEALNAIAEQALDRLARGLGGKAILPTAFQYIPKMLETQGPESWNQRHGALITLSCIAEGCVRPMEKELGSVLTMVQPAFADPHPRVRWAACNCFGQLSTDFAGTMQAQYHQIVLSCVIPMLGDKDSPRVQAHAAASLVNFCEEADKEVLEPYMDSLFKGLLPLLSTQYRYLQEQTITTIATIADSAGDRFSRYYDVIMPMLLNVLRQTVGVKEHRLLRGKAMECATLIALAVGKETVGPQLPELLQLLTDSQASMTDADDPQIPYLLAAWARLCTVMGEDFTPYLSTVLPPLLHSAKLNAEFALVEAGEDVESRYSAEDGWEFVPLEGQQVGIRTTVLDEKCTALEMIGCYADQLKGSFGPHVPEVLEIILPLLKFYFHEGVRHASAVAIPFLLESLRLYGKLDLEYPSSLLKTWSTIAVRINDVIFNDCDPAFLLQMVSTYTDCLAIVGREGLDKVQVDDFCRGMEGQLMEFFQRHRRRQEEAAGDGEGGEGGEGVGEDDAVLEEQESDEALLAEMNRAIQTVLSLAGLEFLPSFENRLLPILRTFLGDKDDALRQWGLLFADDVIEYTGPASVMYLDTFGPALLNSLADSSADARQAGAYGVGLAAQKGGEGYVELCGAAVPHLVRMIQDPSSKEEESANATDNAVSALTKIFSSEAGTALGNGPDGEVALRAWYHGLPLIHDEAEAPLTCDFLMKLLDGHHPLILGDAGPGLGRLVSILTETLVLSILPQDQEVRLASYLKQIVADTSSPEAQARLWEGVDPVKRAMLQSKGYL
ncbi:armadillo-type protein [Piptocephalis cylindrospora]|uniref:Armadillo-type protein n=1 Tax=Piptocephalis cylindrospora TaxID=1907219 RepID=A0A4V1IY72_9FUNG|nr:armadillo-type protein [Piptocephalis cylindrospora]|eukprot:RKP13549.1 armadillo-type protein [Piptocephalis cylindrospora]